MCHAGWRSAIGHDRPVAILLQTSRWACTVTGGAIRGAVRADYFWGFGDAAGAEAGRMRQSARMWVLLPRDYPLPK